MSSILRPVPLFHRSIRPRSLTTRTFSTTLCLKSQQTHYDILSLPHTATGKEIKSRFYHLSKTSHPDLHPEDPHSSSRFVAISEAYSVLGNPTRRERYDKEVLLHINGREHGHGRGGSHHGGRGTGPMGSRPPSGLSKRRTQFRGPPPSFYASGGYGAHGAKRTTHPGAHAHDHPSSPNASENHPHAHPFNPFEGGGFGPSGPTSGSHYDVPHFNRDQHIRTQEHEDLRRRRRMEEEMNGLQAGGSVLRGFFVVSGIVSLAVGIPTLFSGGDRERKKS